MKTTGYKNLALAGITAIILAACSGGGTCANNAIPVPTGSKLIFVAPSILPSLANTSGVNYMGVYNPTDTALSGISYSLGQIVGSGGSITLDAASAKACANIAAKSSCFLKLSVPESTIAGGVVVTASNNDGSEAATPLAIGVQQVPYTESANANGVGLYFYPKAQYSESGVPFMLVTAVVQSPNVGNINTIELVDERGNLIADQYVTSGNSGAGAATLTMGSVVEIMMPLPQGVNLSKNYKVRTSYQSAPTTLSTIAEELGLANKQTQAGSNQTTGTQVYTVTTQGNNINLQFTPSQVYLTGTNPLQYGYLYNIGDLTASQIQVSSSSPNVRITVADAILNGHRVIKVTYELINTTVAPSTNTVTVTANNPAGQTESSSATTNQNVNPLPVPTPSPTPTPTPPGPPPTPALTVSSSQNPITGGSCSVITATVPSAVAAATTVNFTVTPASTTYGFGAQAAASYSNSTTSCTIVSGGTTCSTSTDAANNLCAASDATVGTSLTVSGVASGYTSATSSSFNVAGHYAYVLSQDKIYVFNYNQTTGGLTANGSADTNGSNSAGIVSSIDGKYLYVVDQTQSKIKSFSVNSNTGALTFIEATATGNNPSTGSLRFDPAGKYLYSSAAGAQNITVFSYNSTNGHLTQQSTIASGAHPSFMSFTPNGNYLYVSNDVGGVTVPSGARINMYQVQPNGDLIALSPASIQSLDNNPYASVVDPSGKYLYVTNVGPVTWGFQYAATTVSVFDINQGTGALSYSLTQNLAQVGSAPVAILTDTLGKYAYVANGVSGSISQLSINANNGNLSSLTPATVNSGSTPVSLIFSPDKKFAYSVSQFGNFIQIYDYNSVTGLLTASGAPISTGSTNQSGFIVFSN